MIFTPDQEKFIREEQTRLIAEIDREPRKGLFSLHSRLEALNMLVRVHNVESSKLSKK